MTESRRLFEIYFKRTRPRVDLAYDEDEGCYADDHVQRHWWTWQHARGERKF